MVAIFFGPVLAALLAGCAAGPHAAPHAGAPDTGMQQRLAATEQQLASSQAAIAALKRQVAGLQKQAREQTAALAAMRAAMARMHGGKGASDTLLPPGSKAQRDMEKKLNQIEASLNEPPAASAGEKEKNAYSAAYLALKSGRFDEASQDFAALIKAYPKGEYIDQALYWYGESLYAQHRLKPAAGVLEKLVRRHPKSAKRPAALLRLGSIYKDLHQSGDAVAVFKRLIREYPRTVMAANARLALKQIDQGQNNQEKKP